MRWLDGCRSLSLPPTMALAKRPGSCRSQGHPFQGLANRLRDPLVAIVRKRLLAARCGRSLCLVSCSGRCGKCGCGQAAAALRQGGLRYAPTALRCSASWPVAQLTAFAAFKQVRRVSQRSALRARPRALRFLAPRRRATTACPHPPLQRRWCVFDEHKTTVQRGRRYPLGANCGATRSGGAGSARFARLVI